METRARELMQERGLTAATLAARMDEKANVVTTALCRGLSALAVIERFARGLRVPVWEMLHRAEVSAIGHEQEEWDKPCEVLRLEALMHERGLTQAQLAERMGANRPNVNKWMHSTKLTLATIEQFAKALGVEDRLYLLFVTQEEYDHEMERRASLDPAMMAEVERMQRAEKAVNNYQLSENNGLRADVNGMGTEPDLFTQMAEEPQRQTAEDDVWKALPDGCYAYGNVRIELFHGRITIREKPKHH